MSFAETAPLLACLAAFVAGLIDAIVGGGGLIQLPALLVLFPQTALTMLLGTNKLSSIAGTATAVLTYARHVALPWHALGGATIAAFIASGIGAKVATLFPPAHLKPVIFVILVAVFLYTLLRPTLGLNTTDTSPLNAGAKLAATSAVIGAYDGFLGPGTGNFLIFAMVRWLKMPFLLATASAKVINAATNAAAILLFAATGNILFALALPMAAANLLGGYLGAKVAIARGNQFIRVVFIAVVGLLIFRLGYDLFSAAH
ncbi:MAG: sulfite exporter TauE/SafE family protein [Proteobacteria bacterium]|nr:sulfite exporter TauE/SafE family protein [Pseudomonadota bacterium]